MPVTSTKKQKTGVETEKQNFPRGWLVAGGCLAALVLFCLLAGILAGFGWWHFDGKALQNLSLLENIPFVQQWLQVLLDDFEGDQNQLQISDVEDLYGDELQTAVQEFYSRDDGCEDLLFWAVVDDAAEPPEPIAGAWMVFSNTQEMTGLLFRTENDQFLAIQSWFPDKAAAETFLVWLIDAGGESVLVLRDTQGRMEIRGEGLLDEYGQLNSEDLSGISTGNGENTSERQPDIQQDSMCVTSTWGDYQNCLSDHLDIYGYIPDIDCVPDLKAAKHIWDSEAALIPGIVLRSLVHCGSPAVECLPAALDDPPSALVLEDPVLLSETNWNSCQDENSLLVSPLSEIVIYWEDDRLPFSEEGEQVYQFPGGDYSFEVQDCAGNTGLITGQYQLGSSEEEIICGAGNYCLEMVEGKASCIPAPETPVPTTSPDEESSVLITASGTIVRRHGACGILDGVCTMEENQLVMRFPQNRGAAKGSAIYRESYPSRDCGSNQAEYRFALEGIADQSDISDLEWTVTRVITIQAGTQGFCRSTTRTFTDSGVTGVEKKENGSYHGEISMSSGETFFYSFSP